jgi:hypothetical protein
MLLYFAMCRKNKIPGMGIRLPRSTQVPINMSYQTVKRQKKGTRQAICLIAKVPPRKAVCSQTGQECRITRNLRKADKKSTMDDISQGRRRSTDRKEDEEMDGTRCLGILDDDTFSFLLHNGGLECRDNGLRRKPVRQWKKVPKF